jgi:hypothetical protein
MPVPPREVQNAARSALDARMEVAPSARAGTPVGIARARDLANGADVSTNTLERMYSYLMQPSLIMMMHVSKAKTSKTVVL